MTDHTELKRLAEAFPADLDWDSNTEPFFNGPSGESLGGGSTGFYCVYGASFEIDGEQYDGHTYVETCKVDFAKFMCTARDGVLSLIAENDSQRKELQNLRSDNAQLTYALKQEEQSYLVLRAERDQLRAEVAGLKTGYEAYERVNAELKAEIEALSHWRDLALQFDNHRMAALWHLKRLLVEPQWQNVAELFLGEPPLAAHEVVAERDQLRKSADRYQWLRDRDLETIREGGIFAGVTPENLILNGVDLDRRIDAAMGKGEQS